MFPHIGWQIRTGGALAAGNCLASLRKGGFPPPPAAWLLFSRFAVYALQVAQGVRMDSEHRWIGVSGFLGHRLRGRRHRGAGGRSYPPPPGQRARGHGARLGIDPQPRLLPCWYFALPKWNKTIGQNRLRSLTPRSLGAYHHASISMTSSGVRPSFFPRHSKVSGLTCAQSVPQRQLLPKRWG